MCFINQIQLRQLGLGKGDKRICHIGAAHIPVFAGGELIVSAVL